MNNNELNDNEINNLQNNKNSENNTDDTLADVQMDDFVINPQPVTSHLEHNYYYEVVKKPRNKGLFKFVTMMVIISLVGGATMGASFAFVSEYLIRKTVMAKQQQSMIVEPMSTNLKVEPIVSQYNSISDIAEDVGPSIVSIVNNQIINTRLGSYAESGLGSGVIFGEDDEHIYIISNAHVVEGATTLTVTFLGNYKVPAQIVGMDNLSDVAVISVHKGDIPVEINGQIKMAPLGDSDALSVGELAIAIGTPLDEAYNNTVTVGIISALNRSVAISSENEMSLIQTDAAINPGNSGGALIGPTGEVIGINTIKLVDSDIEGMGFAIPINDVKIIVDELMEHGRVIRPSLGIVGATMTQEVGDIYEIPVGVIVASVVSGSGAEIAGIMPYDIILEFDGQKVSTIDELIDSLDKKSVGDIVDLRIIRGNEKFDISVTLTEIQTSTTQPTPNYGIPNYGFIIPN